MDASSSSTSSRDASRLRYPPHVRAFIGIVLATGFVLRLWLIFGLGFLEEDSLITLRYAKNLWEGSGLVYNIGEKVMGFTSPLWTLITAPIVGTLNISTARIVLTLLCLLLYSCAVGLFLRLGSGAFRLGSWGLAVFAGMLALEPRLAAESVSGMEMSLFVFWIAAALWAVETNRLYLAFAFASASYLTRPEGAIFWAVLFLYVAARRHWSFRKLPFLEIIVPSVLIVVPWLAFATLYYGTPIPRSAASKSLWGSGGFSLRDLLFRPADLDLLWRNATGLYVLKLPPVGRAGLVLVTVVVWVLACWIAFSGKMRLVLACQSFFAFLILFYYLGRGLFFPWYAVTTIILFSLAVAVVADALAVQIQRYVHRIFKARYSALATHTTAVVGSLILGGLLALMVVRVIPWKDARSYEDTVLAPTGSYLHECTPSSANVMLEPIGYIGFYSERKILDLAGLVSPEFRPTPEKFQAGWGARQILDYEPDYLILRVYEVPENKFFASFDVAMFVDHEQQERFNARYVEAVRIESTTWPERSLIIYRRADMPVFC
jgi:hypothetical protein